MFRLRGRSLILLSLHGPKKKKAARAAYKSLTHFLFAGGGGGGNAFPLAGGGGLFGDDGLDPCGLCVIPTGPPAGPIASPPTRIIRASVSPTPGSHWLRWHHHLLSQAPAFETIDVHRDKFIRRLADGPLLGSGNWADDGHELTFEVHRIHEAIYIRVNASE